MSEKGDYEQLKLENQLCFPLYAASRKVISKYQPYFQPLGITYTQYLVFMVLWEDDDLSVGDICKKLYLDSGTLTPLLKKMEEKGWIKRTRMKFDERIVHVSLTGDGRAMRAKCKDIPSQVGTCVKMDPEDAKNLHRILYELIEVL